MIRQKRIISILLITAFIFASIPNTFAFQYTDMVKELSVEGYEITTVAPDVRHIALRASDSDGKQNINAVEFNPQNPYTQLRAGKSQGYVWSTQTVNTIATNMSDTNGGDVAVAAINGDFFTFGVGVPHGIFIEDGVILSTPPQYYAAFGLTYDDEPFIVRHGTILDKIFRIDDVLVDVAGINMAHTKGADSLMLYTEEYARGTKTGTETYEIRCRINSGEVRHGSTLNFTVEEIYDAVGNTTIGDGYVVLSAQGTQRISDLKKLECGDALEMTFRFNEFWSNVKFAVGGIEILLKDGEVYSTADSSKQPRTSIGIRADGTVVMATFDGRGAGNAAGMSYQSAAEAMRALGCVDALNLDGGGSTTFVLRSPGEMNTSVVNNVSGSSPRQVANALVLMNTAPTGVAKNLTLSPSDRLCLAGGEYSFTVKNAYDENYKPLPVPDDVMWYVDSYSSSISEDGTFFANQAEATTVTAVSETAEGSVNVEVIDSISAITTDKTSITAKAGESFEITASATYNGRSVEAPQSLFEWSAPESLGTFTEPGKFTLSETAIAGNITVCYGDVTTTVEVLPETPAVEISGFETNDVTFIPVAIGTKTAPDTELSSVLQYAHTGNRSLRTNYNFLDTTGSVGSYYMVSPESIDSSAYHIANAPKAIGMMVYGDGSGVELRSIIEDADKLQHSLSYGKILHTGWQYMEAELPSDISGPIYLKVPVHLVSNPDNLTQGSLYFDNLRAIYSSSEQDFTSPLITKMWPSIGETITTTTPSIGIILRDGSATASDAGIDPKSISLLLNGYECENITYDPQSGKISCTVESELERRCHSIIVIARDRSGNPIFREWVFEVK